MNQQELLQRLSNADCFCFDTETAATETGDALTIHSLQLVGIAFAFSPGEAYYLPVPEDYNEACMLLAAFKPFFENPDTTKVGHNLKYDINVLRRYGIMVQGPLWDTMLAHYLYDPTARHGLKELSRELLGQEQTPIEELIGTGRNKISMRDVPIDTIANYACQDADMTLRLKHKLEPLLQERNLEALFHDVECPLIYVLADMEYTGVKVDTNVLYDLYNEADDKLNALAEEIEAITGNYINFNSSEQLRVLLFEDLGLTPVGKTKHGNNSVGKKSLKKMRGEHTVVSLILQYKELASIINTFLATLPGKVHPATGRVHTSFRQARTATGRLSSSSPNLQNIPKAGDFGRLVRKAFVAGSADHVLVAADYSQIELRLMAHFSQDTYMTDAFINGDDIHATTAARLFTEPPADVDEETRRRRIAKTVNFGLNYGMSAQGLADNIWDATNKKVEVEEAQEYMDRYFDEFKGVTRYHDEAVYLATVNDYCETLFGRRRYLEDIHSGLTYKLYRARRLAINGPIQGSAADIIKIAMVNIHRELKAQGFDTKMVLSVHDEIVFDVPKAELDRVVPLIRDTMQSAAKLSVPLIVKIDTGDNWLEAH
jgi:DNA polymerase-1